VQKVRYNRFKNKLLFLFNRKMNESDISLLVVEEFHPPMYGRWLQHAGYTNIQCVNNPDMAAAQADRYNLIIMNATFSHGIPGYETCEKIKNEHPNVKVIMMADSEVYEGKCSDAGADYFFVQELGKTESRLIQAVNYVLGKA